MKTIHFKSQKERLAYLKGQFAEIVPREAKPISEEKPKKARKGKKKDGKVQAE